MPPSRQINFGGSMKITVEKNVRAPVEQVWACYTTPDDILQWNAPSADWHTTQSSVDLRVGGTFSSRIEARDGNFGYYVAGTYTQIIPRRLIEYAFGGRAAKVEFTETPQGVSLRITFDSDDTLPIEHQQESWQATLDNFARHVESRQ
jgi:uncharacterized protein YndB with AHSA1/START domain